MQQVVDPNIKPDLYDGIPNGAYHAGPGISKSGLWTIHTKTPAHYKFPPVKPSKPHLDLGDAMHTAILEPNNFENLFVRGPVDRKGNKWTDAVEIAKAMGRKILTDGDYETALKIRDVVLADPVILSLVTQGEPVIEASGYWIDEETGVLCRFRPDLFRRDLGLMIDLKTARGAGPSEFSRSVVNYGYHAQEAFYTEGLSQLGVDVQGVIFIACEKEEPFAKAVYELPPSIVDEGRAIMRKSLNTYAECLKANHWPSYPEGVTELKFPKWAYSETQAPDIWEEENV